MVGQFDWEGHGHYGSCRRALWYHATALTRALPVPHRNRVLAGLAAGSPASIPASLPITMGAGPVGLALLVAVGGGALAVWVAARRAAALKPADALRRG